MSVALRKCEHAFNEDVLPPHAKVAEPLEFYAAPKLGLKDAIGKTGPGPVAARRSRSSRAEESA
jgi:hypothetical protein